MSSKTALFVQQQRDAPPAMLADAFAEAGYEPTILHIDELGPAGFPDPREVDVVVSLGSERSVYEPALLESWVGAEMDFLRAADAAGVPVLGICFGGQLLAQAHGGTVGPSDAAEIGWYTVETDDAGLIPEGPWFQWHSDRWILPPAAIEIARNANASQAFLLRRSLALQFHPELDDALLDAWLAEIPNPRIGNEPVDTAAVRRRTTAEQPAAAQRVRTLVAQFLSLTA